MRIKHIYLFLLATIFISCTEEQKEQFNNCHHESYFTIIANLQDSINIKDSIIELQQHKIDSLEEQNLVIEERYHQMFRCRDSVAKQLLVDEYKLERIKNYNNIAAKGNNIKFLRGWINRVLND